MTDDLGPLFSPGQYDALTVDKPERQRKLRPEAEIVRQLRIVFVNEGDRMLFISAAKLYRSIGTDYARRGLDALARLPGWTNAIIKHGVPSMTQVTRIEQAACSTDGYEHPVVPILVEMGRRQALLQNADQEIARFMQEIHTAHPALRKQIKQATESVLRAAFQSDKEHAPELVTRALDIARKDGVKIKWLRETYRVPKETAAWLQQIVARL